VVNRLGQQSSPIEAIDPAVADVGAPHGFGREGLAIEALFYCFGGALAAHAVKGGKQPSLFVERFSQIQPAIAY
jgi:hypothetical protein